MEQIWNENHETSSHLYLKCDVLLLAEVFEKVRNNSLNNSELYQIYYLSTPALGWDALLHMAKVELELIPDSDIYIFFEKGATYGVSYISDRYSKANNKYLKSYDWKQESNHTIYLDANNLHGYTMSKFLPTSGFIWTCPKEFDLNK